MQAEDKDTTEGERKTLKQQLQENREKRFKEYREKLETQNSSYILDEEGAKFYEELRHKDLEKEMRIKQQETIELKRFKQLQGAKRKSDQSPTLKTSSVKKAQINKIPRIIAKANPKKLESVLSSSLKKPEISENSIGSQENIKLTVQKDPTGTIVSGYSSSEDEEE